MSGNSESSIGKEFLSPLTAEEEREFYELDQIMNRAREWVVTADGQLRPQAIESENQEEIDQQFVQHEELRQRVIAELRIDFSKPFSHHFTSTYGSNCPSMPRSAYCDPNKCEVVEYGDDEYRIYAVPSESFAPGFGMAFIGEKFACVRDDLPDSVYKWVRAHEFYHLIDTHTWGGTFGMELRANIHASMKHPGGIIPVIIQAVKEGRLKRYLQHVLRQMGFNKKDTR